MSSQQISNKGFCETLNKPTYREEETASVHQRNEHDDLLERLQRDVQNICAELNELRDEIAAVHETLREVLKRV